MKETSSRVFPFVPRSNASLRPGDFWGIKIAPNTFVAGRVLEVHWQYDLRDRRGFLAALMDWYGPKMPRSADLVGKKVLEQGEMHIRAFTFSNWAIDGHLDLSLDGIEPYLCRTAERGEWVRKGLQAERIGSANELQTCPVRGVWGMTYILELAKHRFR